MKKFLCMFFCILACVFTAFWMIVYIVYHNKNQFPDSLTTVMWINIIVFLLALIVGVGVIKISIDQWFPGENTDIMANKDKILIIIVSVITFVCVGLFIYTIVDNNINEIRVGVFDNMKLRVLMLILVNTYTSFAYFQHFQVARFIE